ncbi:MAG: hypothetical protein M3Z22_06365 [Verrucomicrobiota bacterium]|nr:hypothetical protein [Verrucomicrobiota bacterium]
MAALFFADSQVAASLSPFCSVRGDSATARAEACDEMGQLVPERPVDFFRAVRL